MIIICIVIHGSLPTKNGGLLDPLPRPARAPSGARADFRGRLENVIGTRTSLPPPRRLFHWHFISSTILMSLLLLLLSLLFELLPHFSGAISLGLSLGPLLPPLGACAFFFRGLGNSIVFAGWSIRLLLLLPLGSTTRCHGKPGFPLARQILHACDDIGSFPQHCFVRIVLQGSSPIIYPSSCFFQHPRHHCRRHRIPPGSSWRRGRPSISSWRPCRWGRRKSPFC
mmetsp:Transcript_13618/g.28901  ORF Transcript_13618/g.28901 Transcript_13618/m.28901 type:complete len:226 (+) Transcript_13618:1289-1966(+)